MSVVKRPKAEVIADLDKLNATARLRMTGADPWILGLRPAETDWMTAEEMEIRERLVSELPSLREERIAAIARVAAKRAARRAL